ncbi:MAG: glycosyltransferase family A protein [Thermoplasmatales archaeon]
MNDILGICIPTYNREVFLLNNLRSIIPQFKKFQLPIYISDNCSDDNTKKVIEELSMGYPNINLNRNNSNIGLYLNILNVISMPKTEYIWLMGDDDEICEDAVSYILNYLKKKPDFLVLNAQEYDSSLQTKRSEKIIPCGADLFFPPLSHEDLLVILKKWAFHGYMSSMIIRKDLVDDFLPVFENPSSELFGNAWLPLVLFYRAIVNKRGIFTCRPLIRNRPNPRADGKDFYEHMHLDHLRALFSLQAYGYDIKTLKKAASMGLLGTIAFLIQIKSNSDSGRLRLTNDGPKQLASFYEKLLTNIINITPTKFARFLNKVKEIVKNSGFYRQILEQEYI